MTDRIQPITMPKWGMTMTEGKVADWLKAPGTRIEKGDEVVEIETEKITNVVEAEQGGLLRRIVVPEGQSAPCGSLIAVFAEPEVEDSEIESFVGRFSTAAAEEEGAAATLTASEIEAGGVTLRVVTAEGPEGATPAILLHGFGADAAAWLFTHEALAEHRTVHAIELPSHGGSQVAPCCASVDDLTACVEAAVAALAPDGAHLVGHSLGGRLALRLAAGAGTPVRSLSLIAPAGLGAPVNHGFVRAFIEAGRRRPMKAALQMLVADPSAITSEMIERTLSYKRIDGVPEALAAIAETALLAEGATRDGAGDLAAVAAPVLVLWGARDEILPPPGGLELTLIDGAGHMPQMEAASAVNRALAAHMEQAE